MTDLRWWMTGFGLLIGLLFPFAVVLLGVPSDIAIRPALFAATVAAGLLVGEVNHLLAPTVVGVRLRTLAAGMLRVEATLVDAAFSDDWESCDASACLVPVDSADDGRGPGGRAADYRHAQCRRGRAAAPDGQEPGGPHRSCRRRPVHSQDLRSRPLGDGVAGGPRCVLPHPGP